VPTVRIKLVARGASHYAGPPWWILARASAAIWAIAPDLAAISIRLERPDLFLGNSLGLQ
jgi:hypothetical protein